MTALDGACVISTAATGEPVTLGEARAQCKVEDREDDALIEIEIAGAREYVEERLGRSLMLVSRELTLDRFPSGSTAIKVPFPPLRGVTSIKYDRASDDTEQTLAGTVYTTDVAHQPGRVYLAPDQSWPSITSKRGAVRMIFTAGYSSSATVTVQQAAVPARAKAIVLLLVAEMYRDREPTVTGTIVAKLPTLDRLISQLEVPSLA